MQQFDEQDYTQRFSLSLWRKILLYAKEYYPDLIRLAVTMAVTAGCDVVFPLMTTYAIDHFIPNLDHAAPWRAAGVHRRIPFDPGHSGGVHLLFPVPGRKDRGGRMLHHPQAGVPEIAGIALFLL
jgi:ABC-type multidrug transport system fused ATPase/permease subunit